jgi:tetratricopeptide (TPR) repeat protein
MPHLRIALLSSLLLLILAPSALAVLSSDTPPTQTGAGDSDYVAAVTAWKKADWPGVIEHMTKVIEHRPWHDDAYNMMGFAYRKLGDYNQSLVHYRKALELNPHHRGALEYLGEAYLELGNLAQANAMLKRLESECRNTDGSVSDCQPWKTLKTAIDGYIQSRVSERAAALDIATTRSSEHDLYRAGYRPSKPEPIGINRIHSWILHLETRDGLPIDNAEIHVSGAMPEHGHGLPTAPQVTRYLGNGNYLVEGVKFHMNGWWQVHFAITADQQSDRVTFNLVL